MTQDYRVAAMALGKGAYVLHQSGRRYTDENIESLLMERHIAKEARRSSSRHHLKGPKKRIENDNEMFRESLKNLLDSLL